MSVVCVERVVLAGGDVQREERGEKKKARSTPQMLPRPRPRRSNEPYLPPLPAY